MIISHAMQQFSCASLKQIQEQVKKLEQGVIHVGVGTPGRIRALIEQDGLSLKSLKYLILDWNWRDQKLRRLIDIPEVKSNNLCVCVCVCVCPTV
ncbi:hypothetical protein JD844_032987 [Phrynosoma platyrhinos]|uniref:Uncharacterized protein n=1 Tax=Phrynosoma platyrhinos TaxID=52577 RepID=A0ABQ7T5Y3_PHRPL|nr:hypothetical protein JD844_032987 [Phrynosoma platyrhinos]